MVNFVIDIIARPKVGPGVRKVERRLAGLNNQANQLRLGFLKAFSAIGVGLGATQAIRTLADFSQSMSTVAAITGATEREFEQLRDTAKELGATTRFSATEAADGLTFLARAGFTVEESLASIEGTLRLAQAGALGLGQAADIASNVLQGFRLQADETGRVVDVLALAANSSNTNVSQLGDALKFVAPVAAGLGVSIEETTAAIGALSDAGLQASLAGTGLRRVLSELESPAEKTRQILNELGLSAADVRPSTVGLTQSLTALAEAGIDTGTALEIFGDRGGPAFAVLKESIPDVQDLRMELERADGTAAGIAETMDDNLAGALKAVSSAYEAVIIAFGDTGAVDLLEEALRFLADSWRELARIISEFPAAVGALVEPLAPTIDAILGFFNGMAAGIGVAFDLVAEAPGDVWDVIKMGARDAAETSLDFFLAFGQTVREIFVRILTELRDVIANVGGGLGAITTGNLEAAESFGANVSDSLRRLRTNVTGFSDFFTSNLRQLEQTELLPEVELTRRGAEVGTSVGQAFNDAFVETTTAQDFAEQLLLTPVGANAPRDPVGEDPTGAPVGGPDSEAIGQEFDKIDARSQESARMQLENSKALGDGFLLAFSNIAAEAENTAAVAEASFGVFTDFATDALTDLAFTGGENFDQLADNALKALQKIIIRLLVVKALSAILGDPTASGGGGLFGGIAASRQRGGPVQPGREFLVGERGPERFVPDQPGRIEPMQEQQPPQVNLMVVNETDPNATKKAIQSGEVDEVLVNRILAKKSKLRGQL